MAELAPLKMVYVFEDGAESDIALGTISRDGMLTATRIADGQEDSVATLIAELNGADKVFLRETDTSPETGRALLVKTPVERGARGFLDALCETAKRFYKVELRFDPAIFDGGEVLIVDDADAPEPLDDDPPEPDMPDRDAPNPGLGV